ncbi:MAG: DNA primase noncatalytic subunit PriX [Candidatus Aenigmatarchaeota archaeon]
MIKIQTQIIQTLNKTSIDKYTNMVLGEDPNLVGQEYSTQQWKPLRELVNPIRRSLCSNELVFDIDATSWSSCLQLAKNLEFTLSKFNIPFLRFTSGNWLHYHVFFDKEVTCPKLIIKDYFLTKKMTLVPIYIAQRELENLLHNLKFYIFYFIVSNTKPVSGASFDLYLMKSKKHLIRMEGAVNEKTGYYKSLLLELPKDKPKISKHDLILPEKILYWKIPEELIFYVYDKYMKREVINSYISENQKSKSSRKIEWIERILSKKFSDGRKRLIDIIILPYLINVKNLPLDEAIKITYNWAVENHELVPIKINNRIASGDNLMRYVELKANYVKDRKLKPLSLKNLHAWFSDCKEILKEVVENEKQI